MALEALEGVEEIDGFKVHDYGKSERAKDDFISISHEWNKIEFQIQNGPIKEVGVNGCQVDTIVEAVLRIVSGLNA